MRHAAIKFGASLFLGLAMSLAPVAAHAEDAPKLNVGGLPTGGGAVKGVAKWEGRHGTPKTIEVTQDPQCVIAHKDHPLVEEKFVYGTGDTLQNVFVYVSKGLDGKTFPADGVKPEIDQTGCSYTPHVQGMVKGQELKIKNNDNTVHNVHVFAKNQAAYNKSMQPGTTEMLKLTKPELAINFKCDVHPWMTAYIHVMDNPFFAVTQQDGSFEIKGLPPGEYELTFWHEFARFAPDKEHVMVKIEEGKTAEADVTYSLKK